MKTSVANDSTPRKLFIDFNLYTDGDPSFKNELINLMISDIQQLQHAMKDSVRQNNVELFRKICHKTNVTQTMLGDIELDAILHDFIESGTSFNEYFNREGARFTSLCENIIRSLNAEKL